MDLYNKLIKNKSHYSSDSQLIRPLKKLDTLQIHSAIYKVKKQKEALDEQIQQMEQMKSMFNETDFYLIANSGAMDYIFKTQSMRAQGEAANQSESAEQKQLQKRNYIRNIFSAKHPRPQTAKLGSTKPKLLRLSTREKQEIQEAPEIEKCTETFKNQVRKDIQWPIPESKEDPVS